MTDKEKRSFHILFAMIAIVLISTFETSLWHRLVSPVPNPQIWLSLVIYTFLYRTRLEALLIVYVPCLLIFVLSTQPLGFLLLAQTLLYFIVIFIKNRIFIPGSFYFGVLYSICVLLFQFLLFLFSWLFEIKMSSYPPVWKWLIQSILAFMISPLIYMFFSKFYPPTEISSDEGVRL